MGPKENSAETDELDREEQELRTAAESVDPARPEDADIPDPLSEAEERAAANGETTPQKRQRPGSDKKPDATGATKPETSKETADTAKKPDAAAKDKAKTPPKPGEKPADEANLTPFQKERRRLDDTWKRVEARKAELEQREQALAQRERALAEQQQKATTTPKQSNAPTAEDWEAIAKDYEAEGKLQLAARAKAKAEELRKQTADNPASQASGPRERFTPQEVEAMRQQWSANLETLGKENPELTQEGTPLRTRVAEILKAAPLLYMSGDGIKYAVEFAKTELQAKRVPELEAKVTELEAEVKRLTGLTSLPSGGAPPPAQAKKFDELSLDEQEAALKEEAAKG